MHKQRYSFQRYRYWFALGLLAAVAVYANLNLLIARIDDYRKLPPTDPVSIHERRIEQVRKVLPPTRAIGYVTTVENEKLFQQERGLIDVESLAQYYLTQYTLAPVFVYNSPDYSLVIGNFLDGPAAPERISKNALTPLQAFNDGVILYRKEGKR
jgi:hypothetical protein